MWHLPAPADVRHQFADTHVLLVSGALDPSTASDLAEEAVALGRRSARHIRRASDAGLLDYGVITGDVIKQDAPRLYGLYESDVLLAWIRDVTATAAVERSPHPKSAININVLRAREQQYRWHTDAVPFTVLLFLTTIEPDAGGELLVRVGADEVMAIRPIAGQMVLMDGHRREHAVAPLLDDVPRISVPMVFPSVPVERPDGLDDYLYAT